MTFIRLRNCLSWLDHMKCFFCFCKDNQMIFTLYYIYMMYYIIDFLISQFPIPKIKCIYAWCLILFISCWIWFANILQRSFAFYVHKGYFSTVFFSSCVFLWFWYHGNTGFIKWVKKCFLLCFLEDSVMHWHYLFFKCLVEINSEPIYLGLGLSFEEYFKLIIQFFHL